MLKIEKIKGRRAKAEGLKRTRRTERGKIKIKKEKKVCCNNGFGGKR
jgi:hypothetical protein